ncbi:MAG: autotransporter outer membrane beta-barrel domain-containing protein, partial [Rhizomicrobium sp.]|nr:autotransporter outer membrane beta-barrel domain-containing protein [Rhizomicrobium sp.]
LYLYWDWIVANNPYKYVSAKAGDGSWTDPSHWVINLDPNYVSIVGGALSNTLPTTPAQGLPTGSGVNSPKFGEVCYFNDCYNIATNKETIYPTSADSSGTTASGLANGVSASPAQVVFTEDNLASDTSAAPVQLSLVAQIIKSLVNYESAGQAAEGSAPINGVTIQGAPGSSNFVPNDTDGNPTTGAPARYYDVTLSAAGTTTLTGATAIIDRLTINGANTGLTITSTGALGSLIDTTVYAGTFRVDGTYVSNGDIALLGGLLTGSGTVVAPYTTAVLGAIAPGTPGTVGTLTVQGSVVLSSGSTFLADVAASSSDLLAVSGTVSLGGTAVVTPVSGYIPKWHENRTILSASAITGSFASVPDTIAGVLYPTVTTVTIGSGASAYQTEVVTFQAASFSTILPNMTDDQAAIGGLLDADRSGSYAAMPGVYDAVDPLTGAALGASLENLAPDAARAAPKVGRLASDAYTSFLWQYLGDLSPEGDAKIAIQTDALKLTQNSHVGSVEMRSMLANLGGIDNTSGAVSPLPASSEPGMALPKGVGAFVSGQKLDGIVTIGGGGGKADVDGYLIALGVDFPLSQTVRAGVSLAIAEAEADLRSEPALTRTSAKQFVAYGQYSAPIGYFISGYVGGSIQTMSTHRFVMAGASTFAVDGHTHGSSPLFGAEVGTVFDNVLNATVKPAIGFQYGEQQFNAYSETGSAAALTYGNYRAQDLDFRAGVDAKWKFELHDVVLRPSLHAFLVTSLTGSADPLKVGFAAAPTTLVNFAVAPVATTWADLGIGLEADVCDNAALGFHFNANPGHGDASYQAFGGSLRVKF